MWWFILTFVVGLAVGRIRWMPAAFLHLARQVITPCLVLLVLFLGVHLGQQQDLMKQLPQIGWQSILIALCVILASGAVSWITSPFFFPHGSKSRDDVGKGSKR